MVDEGGKGGEGEDERSQSRRTEQNLRMTPPRSGDISQFPALHFF